MASLPSSSAFIPPSIPNLSKSGCIRLRPGNHLFAFMVGDRRCGADLQRYAEADHMRMPVGSTIEEKGIWA
jgi:hypothetical protein